MILIVLLDEVEENTGTLEDADFLFLAIRCLEHVRDGWLGVCQDRFEGDVPQQPTMRPFGLMSVNHFSFWTFVEMETVLRLYGNPSSSSAIDILTPLGLYVSCQLERGLW